MKDEQFDDYARLLAVATSRRQFIAVLSVAIIGGLLKSSKIDALTTKLAQATKDPNLVPGSCKAFNDRIRTTGPIDEDGNKHPKAGGTTTYQPGANPPRYALAPAGIKWTCGCLQNAFFDTQDECDRKCREAGCIVLCGGVTCQQTVGPISLQFKANTKVTKLRWQPSGGEKRLSKACRAEKSRFDLAVSKHEQRHVDIANSLAAEASKQKLTKTYVGCGTDQDARNQINNQMQMDLKNLNDQLESDIDKAQADFHNKPEGAHEQELNCDVCAI